MLSTSEQKALAVAVAGYDEPSIVFQLGTETLLTNATGAIRFLKSGEDRIVIIADSIQDDFLISVVPIMVK